MSDDKVSITTPNHPVITTDAEMYPGNRIRGISPSSNQVLGNYIGTDITGTNDLASLAYHGVYITGSTEGTIDTTSSQTALDEKTAKNEFRRNLLRRIEIEPIEDGYTHSAEEILEKAAMEYRPFWSDWVQSIYLEHLNKPAIAASILRCVGRLELDLVKSWGMLMAISALSHPDLELREAAVRALELWGGEQSLQALKTRVDVESDSWLLDYIKETIEDLSA